MEYEQLNSPDDIVKILYGEKMQCKYTKQEIEAILARENLNIIE